MNGIAEGVPVRAWPLVRDTVLKIPRLVRIRSVFVLLVSVFHDTDVPLVYPVPR